MHLEIKFLAAKDLLLWNTKALDQAAFLAGKGALRVIQQRA